ncbi:hypothetical protein BDQ17DRAFT_1542874 [Cyathus striatus]|nr:hypothetical protein BDQ17DRAFT_1542874 [Cyathus striatus]
MFGPPTKAPKDSTNQKVRTLTKERISYLVYLREWSADMSYVREDTSMIGIRTTAFKFSLAWPTSLVHHDIAHLRNATLHHPVPLVVDFSYLSIDAGSHGTILPAPLDFGDAYPSGRHSSPGPLNHRTLPGPRILSHTPIVQNLSQNVAAPLLQSMTADRSASSETIEVNDDVHWEIDAQCGIDGPAVGCGRRGIWLKKICRQVRCKVIVPVASATLVRSISTTDVSRKTVDVNTREYVVDEAVLDLLELSYGRWRVGLYAEC